MPTIWIQPAVDEKECEDWRKTFPSFSFVQQEEEPSFEERQQIEIIYGTRLSASLITQMPRLRWIHSPTPDTSQLCWEAIRQQENLLVTVTEMENIVQRAEFVQGVILSFAKNVFVWKDSSVPAMNREERARLRREMWCMENRVHLQMGLGPIGGAIAEKAKQMGMEVWGVSKRRTFHPFCHKTFAWEDVHSLLSTADVICLEGGQADRFDYVLKKEELALLRQGSILVLLGAKHGIHRKTLIDLARAGKFRGLIWDGPEEDFVALEREFANCPSALITPAVASSPEKPSLCVGKTFVYNLRQYMQQNWIDMKNLLFPHIIPRGR